VSTSRETGFIRNRKTPPWFTTEATPLRSALPVRSIRVASGATTRTEARKEAPFIRGIW
jgi:hypothetical protein